MAENGFGTIGAAERTATCIVWTGSNEEDEGIARTTKIHEWQWTNVTRFVRIIRTNIRQIIRTDIRLGNWPLFVL